ncbi:ubiquitin-conjugating enzyme [Piedraia hortae CBS 480.64]|uniref:Ubiquitin-conjugating enzyme n=1 Tax=Piedraia hortae CBS 480.64 TaxID=1314780 RepID=A0A6A7C798_9PEZI|nr:ubiquitin-conjugating enzyme [Piedraia hortae CBS 480.64]
MASLSSRRLQRELVKLQTSTAPGITLANAENLDEWLVDLRIPDNPIYPSNEMFRLRLTFSPQYPIEPPEVVFLSLRDPERKVPIHPHIYSNGIICLDILDKEGWSPVQNVESICISIQSMLAGNTVAQRPEGDEEFTRTNRRRPRDVSFLFHDRHV